MKFKVEIKKIINDGTNLKATASLILDDSFLIKRVRVVDGEKGMFISMPSRRTVKGEFMELCFPMSKELRLEMTAVVLRAYREAVAESLASHPLGEHGGHAGGTGSHPRDTL